MLFASWQVSITTNVIKDANSYVLLAVAAAVIGGTSLFGGRGKTIHGVLGGLVIGGIYNGLLLLGITSDWIDIVVALVLARGRNHRRPVPPRRAGAGLIRGWEGLVEAADVRVGGDHELRRRPQRSRAHASPMASPESVRRHNLSLLLRHLHQSGALSRSEIGGALGMTRSTIGELVADLRARGLVEEGDPARLGCARAPFPGRPPQPRGRRGDHRRDRCQLALRGRGRARRPDPPPGSDPRISRVASRSIRPSKTSARSSRTRRPSIPDGCWVAGLGIAVAGVVSRADGLVHFAPNLGWREVPLGRLVTDRLGSDLPVVVANEADLGALAEHTWGAGVGVDHLVYVSSEVGVGAGLVIDGRPLVGAAGCAGEVGHFQVNPRWRALPLRGDRLLGDRDRWARHPASHRGYREELPTRGRHRAAQGGGMGDPVALAAVEDVGCWLGIGLAGLVNVFNPQRVVLGGLLADDVAGGGADRPGGAAGAGPRPRARAWSSSSGRRSSGRMARCSAPRSLR